MHPLDCPRCAGLGSETVFVIKHDGNATIYKSETIKRLCSLCNGAKRIDRVSMVRYKLTNGSASPLTLSIADDHVVFDDKLVEFVESMTVDHTVLPVPRKKPGPVNRTGRPARKGDTYRPRIKPGRGST